MAEKDNSNLFLYKDHLFSFHIPRNLFILPNWHIHPRSRSRCPQLWILGNRCQTQKAIFSSIFPPLTRFLGQRQGAVSHKRFMSVERALTLTVQEESLRMFYFFLSLRETSSYQTCRFWIILMLAVKTCEIWLTCLCLWIPLFVNKTFIFIEGLFVKQWLN